MDGAPRERTSLRETGRPARRPGRWFVLSTGLALLLGLLHAGLAGHQSYMDPDGISYMEIGEAWLRGDW